MTIFDLDGTLLKGNSFRWFTEYVLSLSSQRSRTQFVKLCGMLVIRKLHLCSHRRLKWHLMKVADKVLTPDDYREFALLMKERLDPAMLSMLPPTEEFMVLTAASEEYVRPFIKLMGWKYFISTMRPESGLYKEYSEFRGEHKRILLAILHIEISAVFTDHSDDIPLLAASKGRRVLVNPTEATIRRVKSNGLYPEIIYT